MLSCVPSVVLSMLVVQSRYSDPAPATDWSQDSTLGCTLKEASPILQQQGQNIMLPQGRKQRQQLLPAGQLPTSSSSSLHCSAQPQHAPQHGCYYQQQQRHDDACGSHSRDQQQQRPGGGQVRLQWQWQRQWQAAHTLKPDTAEQPHAIDDVTPAHALPYTCLHQNCMHAWCV